MQTVFRAQHLDLAFQPGSQHGVIAPGDACVQHAAFGWQQAKRQELVVRQLSPAGGEQRRHCLSRAAKDFKCALNALRIARMQAGRRFRIDPGQLRMERRPALGAGLRVNTGAGFRAGLRQFGEPVEQRLEVEHGAADKQRYLAARGDPGHRRQRVATKARCRVGFLGADQVYQMVRKIPERSGIGFGRADRHVAKDLRRVDADQLHWKAARQFNRHLCLAAGRRAHQQNGRRMGRHFINHGGRSKKNDLIDTP